MIISLNSSIKRIIYLLIISSFYITVVYNEATWGKYAFLAAAIMIAILSIFLKKGYVKVTIEPFHIFMLLFVGYIWLNSFWAMDAETAIINATTVFQIFACATMIYIYFREEDNIHGLLMAVMWAGYLIAIYTIWLYGFDYVVDAISGRRITRVYNNANIIGMAVAISCVLQINEIFNKRIKWFSIVMMMPALLVVLGTQSRKAMIVILLGIFLLYVIRNMQNKEGATKILKVLGGIGGILLLLLWVLQLPMLSVVHDRIVSMLRGLLGDSTQDGSTNMRLSMMRLGIQMFIDHPLFGSGFGSSYIVTRQELGISTYLHNNFVEILSGGGIVAFGLYYGMYAYLIIKLFRYRNADQEYFSVGLAWLIIMLIMDIGYVSYYAKSQWYYIMIHFLNVQHLKKKSEAIRYET